MSDTISEFLTGFEFVESDSSPVITLDKQNRFYINATARRLMAIKPYERLAIAYNSVDKAIAIIRPTSGLSAVDQSHAATSNYNVDKRYYMYAKHFAREYGYSGKSAPFHFVYERGMGSGAAFIFRLQSDL